MEEVGFQFADGSFHHDTFMDEFADPFRLAPVKQPHFAVRIPSGMEDPLSQILGHPGHGVTVVFGVGFFELPDLGFEHFA